MPVHKTKFSKKEEVGFWRKPPTGGSSKPQLLKGVISRGLLATVAMYREKHFS